MSKRTLQRKLGAATRTALAEHYLTHTRLSLGEIGFLLGFQEPNSFIRADQGWRGGSPGAARSSGR